jgi:parallel beta-helix repeat protein
MVGTFAMKNRKKIIFCLLILTFSASWALLPNETSAADAIVYGSIIIDGNDDLDTSPYVSGLGTYVSPYYITDLWIDAGNNGSGLKIMNTNISLKISDVNVINSGSNEPEHDAGIYLEGCENVDIYNCKIFNNQYGIMIKDCLDIYIKRCFAVSNSKDGFFLWDSVDCVIEHNMAAHNNDNGFVVLQSYQNAVVFNDLIQNTYGIYMMSSSENRIGYNIICNHQMDDILQNNSTNNEVYSNSHRCDWIDMQVPVLNFPGDSSVPAPQNNTIIIIVIGVSVGVVVIAGITIFVVVRRRRAASGQSSKLEARKSAIAENAQKLDRILKINNKVKIENAAVVMLMSEEQLMEFITENKEIMEHITIADDYIISNTKDGLGEFMEILDRQFETWKSKEKSKSGKK